MAGADAIVTTGIPPTVRAMGQQREGNRYQPPGESTVGFPTAKEEAMPIRSVEEMIAVARAEIDNHSAEEAKRRVDEEGAMLVDIRDVRELQREGVI
ncbi:MAG: hypothetical protein GY724_28420, partial [Actinomycetia bacterium]|nr:hypothetical protein [Actinomycetes bacterium]